MVAFSGKGSVREVRDDSLAGNSCYFLLSVGIASLNRRLNIDDALRATVVGRVFSDFRFQISEGSFWGR